MKKVIMPLSPQECERVFNGEQTILVRKRVPKIDTPYEVLAYETKGATDTPWVDEDGHFIYKGRGQVIGSFVCDKVDEYECHKGLTKFGGELGLPVGTIDTYFIFEDDYKAMCLSYDEVKAYGKGKILSGLHITEPKLFDKPKELSDYWLYNDELHKRWEEDNNFCCYDCTDENGEATTDCGDAWHNIMNCYRCWNEWNGWCHKITRPPQSWCYIDSIDVEEV